MVRASGRPKDNLAIVKSGDDHSEVRQVGSAGCGVIRQEDISFFQGIAVQVGLISYGVGHGAKMDRHMRSVGN